MVLNFIFDPLLSFHPTIAILIFSTFNLLVANLFYKFMINQNEARQIKNRMNELNKQAKLERKNGNAKRADELMRETLKENSKIMSKTMKPMLLSMVVILLSISWLGSNFGDVHVDPATGETRTATFGIFESIQPGTAGMVKIQNSDVSISQNDKTISIEGKSCEMPCVLEANDKPLEISQSGRWVTLAPVVAIAPFPFPLTGTTVGWFFWYFLVSFGLAFPLRKLMKIYI